jgi:hypothetical protein
MCQYELQMVGEGRDWMGANLCQSRKVDQRKVEDVRRVDLEIDRLAVDALVASSYPRGFILDLSLNVAKIRESSAWDMMELGPLRASSGSRRSIWIVEGIWRIFILLNVDELQDQRSTCANATSSREEISADDIFQH